MKYRLVIFDIAGTTIADDGAVAKCFVRAFAAHDVSVDEDEVNPLMGYNKAQAIAMLLRYKKINLTETLVQSVLSTFTEEMLDYYEYEPEVKSFSDTEEVFLQLKEKGFGIALNTGFSRVIASAIIKRTQWLEKGLIDDFIASDEVEQGRPAPYMINELMYRFGIDNPEQVVKVGDTEVDINEGRQAQCGLVVAITTGAFSEYELRTHNPDHIVSSLTAFSKLIV
jgi:phosphonatase-like hydrolase